VQAGKVTVLEKLVADLTVELSSVSEGGGYHRRLDHNASLGSLYEFPQVGNGPVYLPGSHPFINSFAAGQHYVLPGSGEKGRPTYYAAAVNPSQGTTSMGYVFNSGDTAWMLTSTALVLLMTMPGTKRDE